MMVDVHIYMAPGGLMEGTVYDDHVVSCWFITKGGIGKLKAYLKDVVGCESYPITTKHLIRLISTYNAIEPEIGQKR